MLPAAVWTELWAHARPAGAAKPIRAGEGDIIADFDPAAGEGLGGVTCEALSI